MIVCRSTPEGYLDTTTNQIVTLTNVDLCATQIVSDNCGNAYRVHLIANVRGIAHYVLEPIPRTLMVTHEEFAAFERIL